MLVYSYSKKTMEYIGHEEALLDPIGKNPMLPASSTTVEPPTVGAGTVAVFDADQDMWTIQEDHRGKEYYQGRTPAGVIDFIGALPEGYSLTIAEPSDEELAEMKRTARNRMLTESDWTQLPDAPLDAAAVAAWATHRQKLRDVPQQTGFPGEVVWPIAPVDAL